MPTYDRPVEGKLYVHLANGEKFEAQAADLERFGLVNRRDAYAVFDGRIDRILRRAGLIKGDVTDAHLNPIRYLVELAVCMPQLLDHPDVAETEAGIVAIEKTLRNAAAGLSSDTAEIIRMLLGRLERTEEVDGLISCLPEILHPTTRHS